MARSGRARSGPRHGWGGRGAWSNRGWNGNSGGWYPMPVMYGQPQTTVIVADPVPVVQTAVAVPTVVVATDPATTKKYLIGAGLLALGYLLLR